MILCSCTEAALCENCFNGRLAQLKGVAMLRGEIWGQSVARRTWRAVQRGTYEPPADWSANERALTIARDKVRDLTRDDRLLELLARIAAASASKAAEERWSAVRGAPILP